MKVSIGAHIKEGPWGGGNLFFKNIKNHLEANGHKIVNHLLDLDIDVILLTDPRKKSESSSFTHKEIIKYKEKINPKVQVVHRINECDERKNTKSLNEFIYSANQCSDATVFVSNWLKDLYLEQGYKMSSPNVIMSGSNLEVFNSNNKSLWDGKDKISIVTHHWGGNLNKGFDVYERLDEIVGETDYSSLFEFTYIGNLPEGFRFKNTKYLKPLEGLSLATELKKNHIYITASRNEPSGNHHIEGALCGLPIMYINSGALPEYCKDYGIEFNIDNLEEKLMEVINDYPLLIEKLKNYPYNSTQMSLEYENLFNSLTESKYELMNINNKNRVIMKLKKIILLKFLNLFRKNKLW